jgi:hypothetical protein
MANNDLLNKREQKFEKLLLKTKNTDLIIAYTELKESINEVMNLAYKALDKKTE